MSNPKKLVQDIQENIEKVIVGKSDAIRLILIALMAGGHVLIEDVPGVGKTTLVSCLARSLNLSFKRIQFTPDILPSDITGFSMYNFKTGEMEFHAGMIMSHVILADEINRTSPKTQSSLLEVMEERQVTVDGKPIRSEPFIVLATQIPLNISEPFRCPKPNLIGFYKSFHRISNKTG